MLSFRLVRGTTTTIYVCCIMILTEEKSLDSVGSQSIHLGLVEKGELVGHLGKIVNQGLERILKRVDVRIELLQVGGHVLERHDG